MDEPMDMDDLFGDGDGDGDGEASVPLGPLPTNAFLPREILQRVGELRLSGCCQNLAWSKLGCIAHINRDGRGISIRGLFCSPRNGKWSLSGEYPATPRGALGDGNRLVHLCWNHSGSDLAVVDSYGRISLFSVVIAINRLAETRQFLNDPEDDLSAVVGMCWLNGERQFPIYRPAFRRDGNYQYSASNAKPYGPYHPLPGKSALISLSRGGNLRLLFQQPDMKWGEVGTELESVGSSDDLFTHASFSPDQDNTLLLAVCTLAHQLRLYRININWNSSSRPAPPNQLPTTPILLVRHVKLGDRFLPLPPSSEEASTTGESKPDVYIARLSHLEIVGVEPADKHLQTSPNPAAIIAVFSHVPVSAGVSEHQSEAYSVISRWELRPVARVLHPSFGQLPSRKSAPAAKENYLTLARQADVHVDKVVVSMQPLKVGTSFALAYSDGTIEFRNRCMEVIVHDKDYRAISSMSQVGFAFPKTDQCVNVALSPNFCQAVWLELDGSLRLKTMEYGQGALPPKEDTKFAVVLAAIALQFAYSCANHNNNDDILSFMLEQSGWAAFHADFLSEIYRALNMSVDYSVEPQHDKLFRNTIIQRCLSMQNSLGYGGEGKARTLTAKVAWATLQLRHSALTLALAINGQGRGGGADSEPEFLKPANLQAILGILRWSLDIICFISDELFWLAHAAEDHSEDLDLIQGKIREENSAALTMVLASTPRTFLRSNNTHMRKLSAALHRALQTAREQEQRDAFLFVLSVFEASSVKPAAFEQLLAELDTDVKTAYTNAGVSESERGKVEKGMLTSAAVPEVLLPVVSKLLTGGLESLKAEIEPATLYFADYSWLGWSDDSRSAGYARAQRVDVIRRVVLGRGARVRRCTRCCGVMEDVMPVRPAAALNASLQMLQRVCYCGSLWILGEDG
ncbi:MAG: mediator complex subunit [Trizodia sp. TS-e1964]|nr:MAG: mediator complex subunit [Trizodia sp. TS-e1964]